MADSKSTVWARIALALAITATVSFSAHAQRGGGGFGGRGGGGFGGGGFGGNAIFAMMRSIGDSPAQFAMRSDVREELGLSEDQVGELREVAESVDRRAMMEELGIDFRTLRDKSPEELAELTKEVQTKAAKMQAKMMADVAKILSAKQTQRLKELRFQYTALAQRDPASALRAADIQVDPQDEEKMRDAMGDAEKELAAKIAQLRRTAYLEALSSVVSQSKLESLMGEAFAFDAAVGRFGGFGGGRGPGGGQAGGGRGPRGGGQGRANPRRPARPSGEDEPEETNPRRRR